MRLPFAVSIATSILCLNGGALAAVYHVAMDGSDASPGTEAEPWATLQHAVDSIAPGDTILVEEGTYAGCRIESSGEPGLPKTLMAYPGAAVVVDGPGPECRHDSNIEVELYYGVVTDWVIDGIEVVGSPRHGIDLRGTSHITVQGCAVHDSYATGIFTAFSDDPAILDNESWNNGEHGVYHSNSGDHPTIAGNLIHHNWGSGIHMNGDAQMKPGDGVISYALVEGNAIWENGVGGGSGINCDGVSDSLLRNNLLHSNHGSGISLFALNAAEGSSRNHIYNNTIVMAPDARWVINIPRSGKGKPNPVGNQIINNILYTPRTDRGSVVIYSDADGSFVSDHNVVANRFSANGGKSFLTLAGWQALGHDLHSMIKTPEELLVAPALGDYRLKDGSAAIDAGASLLDVSLDMDGAARPSGISHDIGCYEAF